MVLVVLGTRTSLSFFSLVQQYLLTTSFSRFGLAYSAFNVTIGPRTNATVTRQDCTVTLGITYPAGLQFAPASFNASGFFELEKGFSGQLSTTYYFSGGRLPRVLH